MSSEIVVHDDIEQLSWDYYHDKVWEALIKLGYVSTTMPKPALYVHNDDFMKLQFTGKIHVRNGNRIHTKYEHESCLVYNEAVLFALRVVFHGKIPKHAPWIWMVNAIINEYYYYIFHVEHDIFPNQKDLAKHTIVMTMLREVLAYLHFGRDADVELNSDGFVPTPEWIAIEDTYEILKWQDELILKQGILMQTALDREVERFVKRVHDVQDMTSGSYKFEYVE